jgi:hypothetical protein
VQGLGRDFCPEAFAAVNNVAANTAIHGRRCYGSTDLKADILQNRPVSDLQAAPTGMSSPQSKKEVVPE